MREKPPSTKSVAATRYSAICAGTAASFPTAKGASAASGKTREAALYTRVYGNPCSWHVDPIEKKPLYHFFPGSKAFSIATVGCNFRCLHCQNHEISQLPRDHDRLRDTR